MYTIYHIDFLSYFIIDNFESIRVIYLSQFGRLNLLAQQDHNKGIFCIIHG